LIAEVKPKSAPAAAPAAAAAPAPAVATDPTRPPLEDACCWQVELRGDDIVEAGVVHEEHYPAVVAALSLAEQTVTLHFEQEDDQEVADVEVVPYADPRVKWVKGPKLPQLPLPRPAFADATGWTVQLFDVPSKTTETGVVEGTNKDARTLKMRFKKAGTGVAGSKGAAAGAVVVVPYTSPLLAFAAPPAPPPVVAFTDTLSLQATKLALTGLRSVDKSLLGAKKNDVYAKLSVGPGELRATPLRPKAGATAVYDFEGSDKGVAEAMRSHGAVTVATAMAGGAAVAVEAWARGPKGKPDTLIGSGTAALTLAQVKAGASAATVETATVEISLVDPASGGKAAGAATVTIRAAAVPAPAPAPAAGAGAAAAAAPPSPTRVRVLWPGKAPVARPARHDALGMYVVLDDDGDVRGQVREGRTVRSVRGVWLMRVAHVTPHSSSPPHARTYVTGRNR